MPGMLDLKVDELAVGEKNLGVTDTDDDCAADIKTQGTQLLLDESQTMLNIIMCLGIDGEEEGNVYTHHHGTTPIATWGIKLCTILQIALAIIPHHFPSHAYMHRFGIL